MRITAVRTAVVQANYDWTFIRVEADNGLAGTGEAFFAPGLTAMVRDLAGVILGQDPRHVDRLWRRLQRAASGAGSVSGIVYNAITGMETALWDLVGQALGVPVWQLLGGKFRDEIRVYADCHAGVGLESYGPALESRQPEWYRRAAAVAAPEGDTLSPEAYARHARQAVARGFDALKFDIDVEETPGEESHRPLSSTEIAAVAARVAAVREAVGPAVELAVDCHWRYRLPDVIRIARALEPYQLFWIEDPVPPFNPLSFVTLRQATSVPLCTGENLFLRHGFRTLIEAQAVHYLAPDIQKVGGLLEARRLADLADMYDIAMAPHCIASAFGTVAAAHLCAAIPNFAVLEFHGQDVPFWEDVLLGMEKPLLRHGRLRVPDGPGLGVQLNEEVARLYAKPGEPFFA
ncbi:MAG: mandelate racemase/muconate lactonizing enzyme family protein [Armatimonadetes bacterium]|nr:mandelate racemase/muconate lactonizing enzyme family protein [Armatimonadota bacterium]